MQATTFEARVVNGQLQYQTPLDALEGHQVRVTVDVLAPNGGMPDASRPPTDEVPGDLDVEKDVYVKMPFKSAVLKDAVVVEGGPMNPCIILPEELPDE